MMKTSYSLITIGFLIIFLASCETHGGEALERFDPADWPTPPPERVEATVTPFPKIDPSLLRPTTLAQTIAIGTSPDAASSEQAEVDEAQSTPAQEIGEQATETPPPTATPMPTAEIIRDKKKSDAEVAVVAAEDDVVEQGAEVHEESVDNTPSSGPTSPPASRTVNPNGGRLLVQLSSGGNIVILSRDGTGLRTLTHGIDPDLSPDGSKVAFTRWDGANQGSLWMINTDGSGERSVLGGMRKVKSPSWAPDSKLVAVNYQDGGTTEVTQRCANTQICSDPNDFSTCSATIDSNPDINFFLAYDIEFESRIDPSTNELKFYICWKLPPDPHWKMKVIDTETGASEDRPAGQYAFAPAWDPANPWRVISTAGLGLVATDVTLGTASPLTNDPSDRGPVFSVDGQLMAVTYRQHDHWEVHRLNPDGSGRVRLTKTPFYRLATGDQHWNNASPAFSPNGSEIAFLTDRMGQWEVWVMNVDGSNQRPMFSEEVNAQLHINYAGNDERAIRWGN